MHLHAIELITPVVIYGHQQIQNILRVNGLFEVYRDVVMRCKRKSKEVVLGHAMQ
jgi:hypothetical protein